MDFDEKQRRRDKWNKKRSFRKKDRFKKKKASPEHNEVQEREEEDIQFLFATLDDE